MSTETTGRNVAGTTTETDPEGLLVSRDAEESPRLSVVMPTLNEEDGIEECITRIKTAVAELGIPTEIIISDSSTDRTPEIAREEGAIVVEPDESGYGYAYRYAFERARGDYVAIGDADTTYDFEELPRLFEAVAFDDADMVMGSRLEGEIKDGAMPPLHQYVGNPMLTRFLNFFYDAGVSDAHSGFRVISREALDELELRSNGMEFASEMIMDASAKGLEIEEVPITYHEREGEATLDSFQDGWRHVKFMLVNAPGYVFSGPAMGLVGLGVLTLALSLLQQPFGGIFFGAHTAVMGSLLVLVGYQIGALSVFSGIVGAPIQQPKDPISDWVLDHFQLEHGGTLGIGAFVVGTALAGFMTFRWVASGSTIDPLIVHTMPVFTAIVLGIQTVFNSMFLSLLAQERQSSSVGT